MYMPGRPERLLRKAQPTLGGINLSPEEVTNALASTAATYAAIITLKEAAMIARVAPSTLKRWVSEGRFRRSAKRGKPLLFWRDRFVAEVMR
jgi:hypothetical protein